MALKTNLNTYKQNTYSVRIDLHGASVRYATTIKAADETEAAQIAMNQANETGWRLIARDISKTFTDIRKIDPLTSTN